MASVSALIVVLASGPLDAQPAPAGASDDVLPERPEYRLLREQEDWSFLRDPARRGDDPFDPVKFVPIGGPAGSFASFGGDVRYRFERFADEAWGAVHPDANGYLLQRYMFHGDVHLGRRARVFAQVKSGIESGRAGGPRPPDEDRADLHQAFAEVRLTSSASRPAVTLRVGRQEFDYGSGRLVSIREGPNVRQSFDATKLMAAHGSWRAEAFAGRPVGTPPGAFDDRADRRRAFWGVYATHAPAAGPGLDVYYLGYDERRSRFDQGTADERRHSVGTRVWGRTGAVDYNHEAVVQWGRFGPASIRAWTVATETGYHLPWRARPRLVLRADVTSGDRDRRDGTLGTFNPLFPKGAYFGLIAPTGPLNHTDVHPAIALSPGRDWTIGAGWLFIWRTERDDGIYGMPGDLIRSGEGVRARFIGHSPGIDVTWRAGRHLSVTAYASSFAAGAFLREAPPAETIVYLAVATSFRF